MLAGPAANAMPSAGAVAHDLGATAGSRLRWSTHRPRARCPCSSLPCRLRRGDRLSGASRLADNPNDKLLPSLAADGGDLPGAWPPCRTSAPATSSSGPTPAPSLPGSFAGVGIATLAALVARRRHRLHPARAGARSRPSSRSSRVIPPLALLPILFIAFGLGETSKITLIALGVAPVMVRDSPAASWTSRGADRQGRRPSAPQLARWSCASCCRRSCRA